MGGKPSVLQWVPRDVGRRRSRRAPSWRCCGGYTRPSAREAGGAYGCVTPPELTTTGLRNSTRVLNLLDRWAPKKEKRDLCRLNPQAPSTHPSSAQHANNQTPNRMSPFAVVGAGAGAANAPVALRTRATRTRVGGARTITTATSKVGAVATSTGNPLGGRPRRQRAQPQPQPDGVRMVYRGSGSIVEGGLVGAAARRVRCAATPTPPDSGPGG